MRVGVSVYKVDKNIAHREILKTDPETARSTESGISMNFDADSIWPLIHLDPWTSILAP